MKFKKIAQVAASVLLLLLISCVKNKSEHQVVMSGDIIEIQPVDARENEFQPAKWSNDEGTVFVIFGYGYNEKKFYEKVMIKKYVFI